MVHCSHENAWVDPQGHSQLSGKAKFTMSHNIQPTGQPTHLRGTMEVVLYTTKV